MNGSRVCLRLANLNDAELLYRWRNEESVRKNSFQEEVITFERHLEWMRCTSQNDTMRLYICMDGDEPIGQVRLDIKEAVGIVNYSVDIKYRCMGYGKSILQLIENEACQLSINDFHLVGHVKKNNIASQKIFESLGYVAESKDAYIKYTKQAVKDLTSRTNVRGGGGLFLTNNRNSLPLLNWLQQRDNFILYSEKISLEMIETLKPKMIISYNYQYLVSEEIIRYMDGNIVNLHISYLPWNRGADPNLWSFIDNTPKGVTIHLLEKNLDAGDIIAQKLIIFDEKVETLRSSYDKLHEEIIALFQKKWESIRARKYLRVKQSEIDSYHTAKDKHEFLKDKNLNYDEPIWELKSKLTAGENSE